MEAIIPFLMRDFHRREQLVPEIRICKNAKKKSARKGVSSFIPTSTFKVCQFHRKILCFRGKLLIHFYEGFLLFLDYPHKKSHKFECYSLWNWMENSNNLWNLLIKHNGQYNATRVISKIEMRSKINLYCNIFWGRQLNITQICEQQVGTHAFIMAIR